MYAIRYPRAPIVEENPDVNIERLFLSYGLLLINSDPTKLKTNKTMNNNTDRIKLTIELQELLTSNLHNDDPERADRQLQHALLSLRDILVKYDISEKEVLPEFLKRNDNGSIICKNSGLDMTAQWVRYKEGQ